MLNRREGVIEMLYFLTDCTIGTSTITIPPELVSIVGAVVNIIKIGVPIILIVLGMIDMGKAVASQKEDEIKKGQKTLISRVIAAAIVFFVVAIVQLMLSIVSGATNDTNIWTCICQLIGNDATKCS